MSYYVYKAFLVIGLLSPLGGVFSAVVGIFVEGGKSEPWGELAGLLLSVGLVSLIIYGLWSEDSQSIPKKPVRLSREGRRELRKAQDRAILDASIERLEYEVRKQIR